VEGGLLGGLFLGMVPFAGIGEQLLEAGDVLDHGTPQAQFGMAVGQVVGGIFSLIGGATGEVCGGIATVTGIGAALGVPAIVVSTGLVVGGLANIGAGIRGLTQAWMEGGGSGSGRVAPSTPDAKGVAWTSHGGKHVASTRLPWDQVVQATRSGPAKYRPGIAIEVLERQVWGEGRAVTNGRSWKVMEFADEIGASGGKASRWVRVEESAGTIHGHPITQVEFWNLTR